MTKRRFQIVRDRRADFGPLEAMARIVCARCGAKDEVVLGTRGVGEWVAKKFAASGWTVGANDSRDLCSACGGASPVKEGLPMVVTKPAPRHAAPAASPSPAALQQRRMALDFLDSYLDHEARRFKDGWSDARIAAESGLSESAVAIIRREFFCDLAPPPENEEAKALRTALATDLAALRDGLSSLDAAIRSIRGAQEVAATATRRLLDVETSLHGLIGGGK